MDSPKTLLMEFLGILPMPNDQRTYTSVFKAKVALAAIKNDKSLSELAMEFAIHPDQINLWKQELISNISKAFKEDADNDIAKETKTDNNRHAKIGQLIAENDFLTKVLGR
jgi:transposase